ncbi:MAG: MFS transporter [Chloroflexi bacterium]|nr:MFS transporter [Chloroflexota bacterium]
MTSGFLTAFALALGASNFEVGVLAALPFLAQPLQLATIPLVERLRRRKAITVSSWVLAQMLWVPIALVPLIVGAPSYSTVTVLLGLVGMRAVLSAVTSCAWNSWLRDLLPQERLGRLNAQRQALANAAGLAFGLAAALFVDFWLRTAAPDRAVIGYVVPLLAGALTLGLASPVMMTMMPEPLMPAPSGPRPSLLKTVWEPFQDPNYKLLVRFLFLWGLALNLATPFFAVYMLKQLGLSVSAVIALSVLSQMSSILFLGVWGPFTDRFGTKAVLSASASLYILVVLGWTFTTLPGRYLLTIPLLVLLHIMAGIAAAGVGLVTSTIGLKLAPAGKATAYLAAAALAASLGAGLGPLIGGRIADYFATRHLRLTLAWADPTHVIQLPALDLTGFDFLFGISVVLGIVTLSVLRALREEGEAPRTAVLQALLAPARESLRPMSSVPGISLLSQFPYSYLMRVPLPGFDIALGVAAYQLGSSVRTAVATASRTQRIGRTVTDAVSRSLGEAARDTMEAGERGADLAFSAARGAMHAATEVAGDVGHLARQAMIGVVRAFHPTPADTLQVIRAAAYGAFQGAEELDAENLVKIALQVLEGAQEEAAALGLPPDLAAARAAQGILAAAQRLPPDVQASLRLSIMEALPQASRDLLSVAGS